MELKEALAVSPYHQMRLFAGQHTFLMRAGDFRGAAAVAEQNKAVAKRTADPTAMMIADWMLGISHHVLGDQATARLLRHGDAQAGRNLLTACRHALEAGQHQSLTAIFISDLAIAPARAGQVDKADAAIDRAMAWSEPTRSHFHLPEMMRIKGELLASGSHSCEAENWFSRSLDLEREQSALAWQLRMATSLALLRTRQGRRDEAPRVLRPVYDRFTEGFDTHDLRAAKRLLDAPARAQIGTRSNRYGVSELSAQRLEFGAAGLAEIAEKID